MTNNSEYTNKKARKSRGFTLTPKSLVCGFTLLEMIVALGLFSIAAVISVSSLFSVTNAQREAVAFRAVQDNLNFAIERMAKSIRVGSGYYCDSAVDASSVSLSDYTGIAKNCESGGRALIFIAPLQGSDTETETVGYRIVWDSDGKNGRIQMASPLTNNSFIPITSDDIEIVQGVFYVTGAGSGDGKQPMVTIVLTAKSKSQKVESAMKLQVTISQRNLDS